MIKQYTVLNDKIFGKMVHPSYTYGKDGYVFGAEITTGDVFSDYHIAFANTVKSLQDYCEEREIPFIFAFEPAKPAVLSDYIAKGIRYDRSWVDKFIVALDKRNVNYVDNTPVLISATNKGETVFNTKYDANHWNKLGGFYGVNNILNKLADYLPTVHINDRAEFDFGEEIQTSLPVSEFPIHEATPVITPKKAAKAIGAEIKAEIELDPSYNTCGITENEDRKKENAPSALVFQGSYMNNYGVDFFANSFSKYTYVHDYQNIFRLPYYLQIFKPDCVIFEVAEYTFSDTYFDSAKMKSLYLPKPVDRSKLTKTDTVATVKRTDAKALSKLVWDTDKSYNSVYFCIDGTDYVAEKTSSGYTLTLCREDMPKDGFEIITENGGSFASVGAVQKR